MSPSIDEFVDRLAPAEQFHVLKKLAERILTTRTGVLPITLTSADQTPIGFLFRCPPMPETGPYTDEDRAEDARRLATLDDTVTLDELIASLDFGSGSEREGS